MLKGKMLDKKLLFIICFFGIIFGLITFVNHYFFRTYALDLGLYSHVALQYSKGILATSDMVKPGLEPMLGAHFDLYLLIFSPFVALFGAYTLLVIQWLALLFGGLGVFQYLKFRFQENIWLPYFAMIYFFCFYGVYAAISYDYHSIVVAINIIPWLFLSISKQNYKTSFLLLLFILIAQENIALLMFFVFIGLIFEFRKNKKCIFILSLFAVFSVVYFLSTIQIFIPFFSNTKAYQGFSFSALGENPSEAIRYLFSHPIESFKMLYTNHKGHPFFDDFKMETHIILMVSGVFFLIFRPIFLFMLLPIYGQKFYHDNVGIWSINGQYSIEFAVILAIGIFSWIGSMKTKWLQKVMTFIVVAGAIGGTIRICDYTIFFSNKTNLRFYQAQHYENQYDVNTVYKVLKSIPKNGKVCTMSGYVPHLIFQNKIYEFPRIENSNYLLLSRLENTYLMDNHHLNLYIDSMILSKNWSHKGFDKHLWLFKRKK
jgi:uncharacterized membrane protein